ncbi:hypothetical protein [Patulibacter defluvii]|uniref:hypothetical protein n=1 Tax=Patulibacter defluvii TaxID=3095358 RepID=UPI002A758B1A|nr:hypothetical protein [Patulibacter sp. DM4]
MSVPAANARPAATRPAVAFSLLRPVAAGIGRVRRAPLATLVPVLVLLLPLVPLGFGIDLVLREGGSAALQGLIAGAPRGAAGALIERPDGGGALRLLALGALLVAAAAVAAAAGLVGAGPTAQDAVRARRGVAGAVGAAWRVWPSIAALLVLQALVVAAVAGAVVAVAVAAGQLRFQLTPVVLTVGLGALAAVVCRLSLWPAIALDEDRGAWSAAVRAWRLTGGEAVRTIAALLATVLVVAVPLMLLAKLVSFVLWRLERAELLLLSPQAIELWSWAPLPLGLVVAAALWGLGARELVRAAAA